MIERKEIYDLVQRSSHQIYRNRQVGHIKLQGISPSILDKDIHIFIAPDEQLSLWCKGNILWNHTPTAYFYTSRYVLIPREWMELAKEEVWVFMFCHEISHIVEDHHLLDHLGNQVEFLADEFAASFVIDPYEAIVGMFRLSFQLLEKFGGKELVEETLSEVGIETYEKRVAAMKKFMEERS